MKKWALNACGLVVLIGSIVSVSDSVAQGDDITANWRIIDDSADDSDVSLGEFVSEFLKFANGESDTLPFRDEKVLEFFLPRAERGDAEAAMMVGLVYSLGRDMPADQEKAIYWLTRAADKGNVVATLRLSVEYFIDFTQTGSAESAGMAEKYLKPLADSGNMHAKSLLGRLYFEQDEYKKAFPYLEASATEEYPESLKMLGLMYFVGDGVELNYNSAEMLFLEFLKIKEEPEIQAAVGAIYRAYGCEDSSYLKKAYEYTKIAADSGYLYAQADLGFMYIVGEYVEKDYIKGKELVECGVPLGYEVSYISLGYIYEFGYGVETDKDEAIKWYKKAADLGNPFAIQQLESLEKE